MRRSVMISKGGERITVETDDAGTTVLDAGGMVVAQHGSDRHEEVLALRQAEGWGVAEDAAVRPAEAADTPVPPADGPVVLN